MRTTGLVTAWAALALGGLPASAGAAPSPKATAPSVAPFAAVSRALIEPAGFNEADLNLLINYRPAIPKTLPAVETLLRRPGTVDSLVPALRGSLALGAESAWSWLGVTVTRGNWTPPPPLSVFAHFASGKLDAYLSTLGPGEAEFLRREAPELFRARAEDTLRAPVEVEIDRLRGAALTDSVMTLAAKLSQPMLADAAGDLEIVLRDLLGILRKSPEAIYETLWNLRQAGVPVVIGTPENDIHRLDRGIVFDPSGNDRYEFPDSARVGSWLLVLDLEGDDVYHAADTVGAAAAFLGLQIVHDVKGNDRYEGVDFAFGSALLGYSRLFDGAGDDVYIARCASLGFAFQGVGVLEDVAGNDAYSSAYLAQGAAGPGGFALLLDRAGNDRYVSRPEFPDDLRYRDHFLSLSQGFSTGFSPRHAGGIGVLWDGKGDDVYTSDIFGQGTGYWFGWGLLMDDAGNDTLRAYQYAQGAGVHFAAGTLWDGGGDDVRVSKGVSQGCGHDGGFGMLADFAGNDSTVAVDMSAGGGNANGLGVYADLSGSDAYVMGTGRTLGHADMRRDRGSLGFFLDAGPGGKRGDALPPESGLREGAVRRQYDGKLQGYGYGLDAR